MGFDDFLDLDVRLTDADLIKLDNLAAKAEKRLEKSKEELQKSGGIFGGQTGPALPKSFLKKQQEKLLTRDSSAEGDALKSSGVGAPTDLIRKSVIDEIKQEQGLLRKIMENEIGIDKASTALNFLENPIAGFKTLATRALPILGGLYAAKEIVDFIIQELTKKGGFLDVWFNDKISDRLDAFRDKVLQQNIRIGFDQVIITNRSGLTSPRDAYNTFELAAKNRQKLEEDFAIRVNTRGYNYG